MTDLPLANFVHDRYSADEYDRLYCGASGVVMRASHRLMERNVSPEQNARVLEVGGGAMPHISWMNMTQTESYTVSDIIRVHQRKMNALKAQMPNGVTLTLHDFEGDKTLQTLPGNFTRIIASHVLEHIPDPEAAITRWSELLSPDGVLSIAIPCDPGWAWRLGQLVAFRGYGTSLTFPEYDLLMSREHVNSVQRILKILRYYFHRPSIRWFPSFVPVVDFNLVCAINVSAKDRR